MYISLVFLRVLLNVKPKKIKFATKLFYYSKYLANHETRLVYVYITCASKDGNKFGTCVCILCIHLLLHSPKLQRDFSDSSNVLLIMKLGWFMCFLQVLLRRELSSEAVFALFSYILWHHSHFLHSCWTWNWVGSCTSCICFLRLC